MSTGPIDLLRSLASGTRGPERAASPQGPKTFERMLELARNAELSSGAPVRLSPMAGVELTEPQLARLAEAADRLEASGATRALVVIDGRALSLDVATRTVTGSVRVEPGKPLVGFDAVLHLPEAHAVAAPVVPPPAGATNPSLARIIPEVRRRA
ncbi:MAG: hypothetical protein FJ255_04610 [Phycisphaerae bacterium]|nr:hypothetical protein [Phycisphaerae bacterium]